MMKQVFLMAVGPTEIIILLVIVLLLFGGKKIPELMRGLGKGVREFKEGKDGEQDATKSVADKTAEKTP